jgi:phosphopantothenate-cysteine ligase/phosphopantothenoylcysteine decarboxylase/phosphopantothenate--cysteine ligase
MHLLVTAGNTFVPIDQVRGITNVFTGRTGAQIALHAQERGHTGTILTSHPETADALFGDVQRPSWSRFSYRTFDDLEDRLKKAVAGEKPDVIVHCAAVSDYRSAGVYALAGDVHCVEETNRLPPLSKVDSAKVKSDYPELWLRLVRTPKLVDLIRSEWGYQGILVKFKLEAVETEAELQTIAERSRIHSQADLMVANTLAGAHHWALVGPVEGKYAHVSRAQLPATLLDTLEQLYAGGGHG